MEKLATDVEEQIALLESRGMTISDKEKAKECLLDIGYFRLGFYWFPFEKTYPRKANRTHEFKEGTSFDYAIRLYYFDYDLRNILLKYISRVEINFRTKLIYHASNRYKQEPFWYHDSKYVNKAFLEDDVMAKAMKDASKEDVIIHDMKTHKRNVSPAWKAMEFFSFGATISSGILSNKAFTSLRISCTLFCDTCPRMYSNTWYAPNNCVLLLPRYPSGPLLIASGKFLSKSTLP